MTKAALSTPLSAALTTALLLTTVTVAHGQPRQAEPVRLAATERAAVIAALRDAITETYVFEDLATRYAETLTSRAEAGAYDELQDARAFAQALTADLHGVKVDKHLRVFPAPPRPAEEVTEDAVAARERRLQAQARASNYGFTRLELLPGNVGYLELTGFLPAEIGGDTAVGAMAFLANADAIIFDLRRNGGGNPSMIQLLSSYLFEAEPRHLNSFYIRKGDRTEQFYTLPHVPGRRRPDVDVYVLTSASTFSAAEEFTYNLKNMERATIVGETTGGGAHPVEMVDLGHGLMASVPFGRAINPITGTNWESTGIAPHVETAAAEALTTAHRLALEQLATKADSEEERHTLAWLAEEVAVRAAPPSLTTRSSARYAGTYGVRTVSHDGGRLYLQRDGGPKVPLIPMGDDRFILDHPQLQARVSFIAGSGGRFETLVLTGPEGEIDRSQRGTASR